MTKDQDVYDFVATPSEANAEEMEYEVEKDDKFCKKHGIHDFHIGSKETGFYCFHCLAEFFDKNNINKMTDI